MVMVEMVIVIVVVMFVIVVVMFVVVVVMVMFVVMMHHNNRFLSVWTRGSGFALIILEFSRFVIPRGRSPDDYFSSYAYFPDFENFFIFLICELEIFSNF